jgi:hypothetical protein
MRDVVCAQFVGNGLDLALVVFCCQDCFIRFKVGGFDSAVL